MARRGSTCRARPSASRPSADTPPTRAARAARSARGCGWESGCRRWTCPGCDRSAPTRPASRGTDRRPGRCGGGHRGLGGLVVLVALFAGLGARELRADTRDCAGDGGSGGGDSRRRLLDFGRRGNGGALLRVLRDHVAALLLAPLFFAP